MSISVIIPIFNQVACLPETLRSVRAEKPGEIVVVDGGTSAAMGEPAREVGLPALCRPTSCPTAAWS
jgi:glycosyltransferase involved in cell wall biosynthesis